MPDTTDVGTASSRTELPRIRARFGDRLTRRAAEAARNRGNHARAAILASRAGERDVARADLVRLTAALAKALGGAPTSDWVPTPRGRKAHVRDEPRRLTRSRWLHGRNPHAVLASADGTGSHAAPARARTIVACPQKSPHRRAQSRRTGGSFGCRLRWSGRTGGSQVGAGPGVP